MVAKSFLLAAVAATLLAFVRAESDVIQLTKATFEDVVKPEKLILVEFFAPWCGHCNALAPEYEMAATALKDDDIKLAKVDCTEEQDLCQEYEVKGYPTLKVFRSGASTDYGGPRQADGIISYMKKQTLPALSEVTADSIDKFKEADRVVIIGFVAESDKESYKTLNTVAEGLRDNFLFGVVTDAELAKKYDVTVPGVLLFKKFDDGVSTFDGALTAESLQSFVKSNSVPLLAEIDGDNFSSYVETGLPLAYIFADNDEDRERLIKALQPVAKEYKGKVNFVHIDAAKYGGHASNLNLKDQWPAFGIQQPGDGAKFPYDQTKEVTFEGVREFVAEYVAGKISPSIKSQAVPEKNDEPVKVVVSTQFDEIVYDKEKDVLIEFYAPWCGHCKKLAPVWEELAALISSNPANSNVVIAKMDGTENDLPAHVPFRLEGFPTLKLFKAGVEKEVIDYSGDRSLEDLVEFLKTNAKNALDIPASAPKVVKQDAEDHEGHDHEHNEL